MRSRSGSDCGVNLVVISVSGKIVDHAGVRPPVLALRVLLSPKFFSLSPADHKRLRIKFVLSVPSNFLAVRTLNEFVAWCMLFCTHAARLPQVDRLLGTYSSIAEFVLSPRFQIPEGIAKSIVATSVSGGVSARPHLILT